jgi:hypothetical protein
MASKSRAVALVCGLAVAFGTSLTPTVVSADVTMTSLGEHVSQQAQHSRSARSGWDPSTGVSKEAWASALDDSSVIYDGDGPVFIVEPRMSDAEALAGTNRIAPVHTDISLASAFTLHSRPGSSQVIYLDFTGHDVTGSEWDDPTTFGANSRVVPAYDIDGNFGTFSTAERQSIIDAWSAVAEDYSMFDVDVTTEEPLQSEIDRSNLADTTFGVRAVITDEDNPIAVDCGCGGIAFVGVYNYPWALYGSASYSPAFAFARPSFSGKTISDIVSHEVGHNAGLVHDGHGANEYYEGRDGWAPIMGAGYSQPLVQWSNGTYTSATNQEDDVAVMQANGLELLTDDHAGSVGASTAIELNAETDGVIHSRSDVDYFRFTASATSVDVSVDLPSVSPNLDINLTVVAPNGSTTLATANPSFSSISFQESAGLAASLTVANLSAGQTYYVKIDGASFGSGTLTGYSDYGSLGEYRVTVASSDVFGQITPAPTPTISGQVKLGRKLSVAVGTWPSGVTTTQQWLRNGSAISGATKSRYKLKTTDLRKRITVRVTATKPGYSNAIVTSNPTSKVRR